MKKGVFGTREWASSNLNLKQNFCENSCIYCYARAMAIRYKRATPESWSKPGPVGQPKMGKRIGTIMMPTTHDITLSNISEFIVMMSKALELGNSLLIVSKPSQAVLGLLLDAIKPEHKDKVLLRFTIGSASDDVLGLWEPGAPTYYERLACLKTAYNAGFKTSVSSEPMLDANIHEVVKATAPYITDAIWLGKANSLVARVAINTRKDPEWRKRAEDLDAVWTDEAVMRLYEQYKDNPKVKWKESIKRVVGLKVPTEAGLDI